MKYIAFYTVPLRRPVALLTLVFAIIVGVFAGSACHAATDFFPAIGKTPPLTLSEFTAGIVTRSADLNYVTEQDSEVFAFYRNAPVKELTGGVFLEVLRRPAETQIISQPWSTFFQIRTQHDPTGRWRRLQEYLEENLTNLTVFRLPRGQPYSAQYDLYAVGIFNGKTVVGVQMFGVAT
jgi:hypothetical protein